MFLPTLMSQGNPEQQETWVSRAYNNEILGTYAQVILKYSSQNTFKNDICHVSSHFHYIFYKLQLYYVFVPNNIGFLHFNRIY